MLYLARGLPHPKELNREDRPSLSEIRLWAQRGCCSFYCIEGRLGSISKQAAKEGGA